MRRIPSWLIVIVAVVLAVLGGMAFAAQDKYTVQVPNGLAFSEFRGYEDWQVVAVSQPEEPQPKLNVIVANPAMIDAYRAGVPGNGKPFPDGSKIAKITWNPKKSAEAPFSVDVPDTLAAVGFIMKDSRRFPDTAGWGYALFDYDPASDTFTPNTSMQQSDAKCGAACHTIVAAKDYIFTAYGKR
jgi:Cytochrome P460